MTPDAVSRAIQPSSNRIGDMLFTKIDGRTADGPTNKKFRIPRIDDGKSKLPVCDCHLFVDRNCLYRN